MLLTHMCEHGQVAAETRINMCEHGQVAAETRIKAMLDCDPIAIVASQHHQHLLQELCRPASPTMMPTLHCVYIYQSSVLRSMIELWYLINSVIGRTSDQSSVFGVAVEGPDGRSTPARQMRCRRCRPCFEKESLGVAE